MIGYSFLFMFFIHEPSSGGVWVGFLQPLQAAAVFTTAIVTGRSKDKVYSFVGLDDVFYAGSHGLEIQGPQAKPVMCQVGACVARLRPCGGLTRADRCLLFVVSGPQLVSPRPPLGY